MQKCPLTEVSGHFCYLVCQKISRFEPQGNRQVQL